MIEFRDIVKIYKKNGVSTTALRGVSLDIEKGEMVAVMGTSGSGKSTLLNIMGGVDKATEGTYKYNDLEVSSLNFRNLNKFRRENVGFVFQNFELLPQYTVYENVEMPLLVRNIKNRKNMILEVLESVGLLEMKDKKAINLSGGQQQRCAIARAVVYKPALVLADEPTGALDKKTSGEIMDLMQKINSEGQTVVIVTHDENVAKRCKRVIQIEDGTVL